MTFNNKNMQTNDLLYYLTMNMNNICRVCLEKSSKLVAIFDPIKPPHFSVLIMACASVQVTEGDGLPPYICQKCISKLNIAFQFKTQCESSDEKLRQCFESFTVTQATDLPGFINIKKNVDNSTSYYTVADDCNKSDNENLIKHEQGDVKCMQETNIQESFQTERQLIQSTHDTQETDKTRVTNLKVEGESVMKIEDINVLNVTDIIESHTSNNRKSKKNSKPHQCDTCGKIFRLKPSLVHHIRIHTGERPYVCHLCEKRFINGGHLHTHMRIHTGEKNHICVACNKAFATAQQLTKHTIAIHTSERPYGCTYCSKRFASSSNLNTHIKIHTGEKNYHCEHCGKAFSTKGQLYQHMLVHTGEKAFLCEYCNKRFSQKAHLLRHLKTHNRTS
ncbi:zinc finger protein 568-like [Cylas formicarius]|uniref:zinc finger protein 568-like n=1 Tax=Cylas formicarius TaxID=197179 RepID=UPI0029586D6E|nr:zinc finger protein 568-like [Cylas formicarius]